MPAHATMPPAPAAVPTRSSVPRVTPPSPLAPQTNKQLRVQLATMKFKHHDSKRKEKLGKVVACRKRMVEFELRQGKQFDMDALLSPYESREDEQRSDATRKVSRTMLSAIVAAVHRALPIVFRNFKWAPDGASIKVDFKDYNFVEVFIYATFVMVSAPTLIQIFNKTQVLT